MKFETKEQIAKFAIEYFLKNQKNPLLKKEDVLPNELKKIGCCFVTICVDNFLRGCIGSVAPTEPLYLNIVNNAAAAAFSDFRFPSITKQDLKQLRIEISVLTPLKKISFKNQNHLRKFLTKEKPGVLIKKGDKHAVFLPQVWQELNTVGAFLSELCLKAEISPRAWQNNQVEYWIFYLKN